MMATAKMPTAIDRTTSTVRVLWARRSAPTFFHLGRMGHLLGCREELVT
jgi:hypothetical protein